MENKTELMLKEEELESMKGLKEQYIKERDDLNNRVGIARCMSLQEIQNACNTLTEHIRHLSTNIQTTEREIERLKEQVD